MAVAKDTFYWVQLRTTLTAGPWESNTPAKALNGNHLTWTELFHKFRKHCSKHAEVADAASQLRSLSVLLCRGTLTAKNLDGDFNGSRNRFELGDDCVLIQERGEEARKAYEALRGIGSSSNEYVQVALGYFAYALDRPQDCIAHLNEVSFSEEIDKLLSNVADNSLLKVPVSEDLSKKPKRYWPFSRSKTAISSQDLEDGKVWVITEAIRGRCLQGMAYERLSSHSRIDALDAYERGTALLASFHIPKSPPSRPGKVNFDTFNRYRELWRWSERLLWRAIILSSHHQSADATIRFFRIYTSHSEHWPATFRSSNRITVCSLYLRALVILAPKRDSHIFATKSAWSTEARSVVNDYRAILSTITSFPRAGERNVPVEEFVDYCVAIWEAGGANGGQAGWVIDILWWASRLTFNSQRVLRHMTRLLHVSGDHDLAKRTLKLYVQIVTKERETGIGAKSFEPGGADNDEVWIEALIQGARMLCRIPGEIKEIEEAEKLLEHARKFLNDCSDEIIAKVDLAAGISKSIFALREQEPETRGLLLDISLDLLLRSIERSPSASAYYHAALAYSRPGVSYDLFKAINFCKTAVEKQHLELRYWHLLVLLETKAGEWKKAKGVLEVALGIADEIQAELYQDDAQNDGITVKDFAVSDQDPEKPHINGNTNGDAANESPPEFTYPPLLSSSGDERLPFAATLLLKLPDHPPATRHDIFEQALQLRMTDLALTELVEGSDSVREKWLQVFSWFGSNRDVSVTPVRSSMDAALSLSQASGARSFTTAKPNYSQQLPNQTPSQSEYIDAPSQSDSITRDSLQSRDDETVSSEPYEEQTNSTSIDIPTATIDQEKPQATSHSRDKEIPKGKKVQRMLKEQVHKSQAKISTISKKISHARAASNSGLHKSRSVPDISIILARSGTYQASSIHSRKRIMSWGSRSSLNQEASLRTPSPLPPPLPLPTENKPNGRGAADRRLLSNLWLMSAATFRRMGQIEETRAAVQEAEVLDEGNPAVWVQLGLYFTALGNDSKAIEAFNKALFISIDDVSAVIHLCRLYLTSQASPKESRGNIDIAAGMLEELTCGAGWDVAEAWYLLAKAYNKQDRKDNERECLLYALGLSQTRAVRDIGTTLGWCI